VTACIYCLELEPTASFVGVEHVLMKAFGRFRDNLTLSRAVCDACNAFFGNTLDHYLARDTPYGIARFISGAKPSSKFKGVGSDSQMTHVIDEGVLAGAEAHLTAGPDRLNLKPPEQLGFGISPKGPMKWFPVDRLPSKAQLRLLFPTGDIFVHLLESEDPQRTFAKLEAGGLKLADVTKVETPEERSHQSANPRLFGLRGCTRLRKNWLQLFGPRVRRVHGAPPGVQRHPQIHSFWGCPTVEGTDTERTTPGGQWRGRQERSFGRRLL